MRTPRVISGICRQKPDCRRCRGDKWHKSREMKVNNQSTNKEPQVRLLPKPDRQRVINKARDEWRSIPWRKLEQKVNKLQKRIYTASQRGETLKVRKLQKLLMKSRAAKLLSVRRVTQENKGKLTAGVDGVKALSPHKRLELAKELRIDGKAMPTRRKWIDKPGRDEKRPLGIPVMKDRAKQMLAYLALDPEWEAIFEPNSYGFRKGRSCHDAIKAVWDTLKRAPKWVLDADIAKCFDCINHKALLRKLNTTPSIHRQIKAWLRSGVLDGMKYFDTNEGTPQGGVISPLLANVALHGMENRINQAFKGKSFISPQGKKKVYSEYPPKLIRYADDFVILHEDLSTIQQSQKIVSEWLQDMGLELKPEKTRITHTLNGEKEYETGFDFLGFNVRQHKTGKNQSETKDKLERLGFGFHTVITPSKKKVKAHLDKVHDLILKGHSKAKSQARLIGNLNPVVRGWANYYSTVNSKEIFSKLDHLIYQKLKRWGERRHPKKNKTWVTNRYWGINEGKGWIFAEKKSGAKLLKHTDTKVKSPGSYEINPKTGKKTNTEYVKVKGKKSPYDGDIAYWAARTGKHPELPDRKAKLIKQQGGRCTQCELYLTDMNSMEVHHKDGNHKNNKWENLELIHQICHDRIHGEITIESSQADGIQEDREEI